MHTLSLKYIEYQNVEFCQPVTKCELEKKEKEVNFLKMFMFPTVQNFTDLKKSN